MMNPFASKKAVVESLYFDIIDAKFNVPLVRITATSESVAQAFADREYGKGAAKVERVTTRRVATR